MRDMAQVEGWDPSMPAPPLLVDVRPEADQVGHGRILPMVGGRRNYIYDVLINDGQQRVYADDVAGVLSKIIPGYESAAAGLEAAVEAQDRISIQRSVNQMFLLRAAHARAVRQELQGQINDLARRHGTWESLSEEEREQCEGGAAGLIPVGVIVEEPFVDPDGTPITVERGVWEHAEVKLVIDRGDYGLFDPDGTPEPTSELAVEEDDGRLYVYAAKQPDNMIVLDSTDDEEYLGSLEQAGVVSITIYSPDVEDATYLDAVRLGRDIMDVNPVDLSDFVGFHDHEHDHDHDHDHEHGDGDDE